MQKTVIFKTKQNIKNEREQYFFGSVFGRWSKLRRRLVRVHKVSGELSFAFNVDDSSEGDAVADALEDLGRFLRYLGDREERSVRKISPHAISM